jgi:isopentenyldiphosphate isomerase
MLDSSEEILDLVNENDEVIGQIRRGDAYAQGVTNFRVIDAFIRNSEGKLFIPRRHKNKKMFPNRLDTSVGGHVESGETYEEALKKEAKEELNIDISLTSFRVLGKMTPHGDKTAAFITVFEIESDETPDYNRDDFSEHYWLTPQEILLRLENGDAAKGNLPKILRKFYL